MVEFNNESVWTWRYVFGKFWNHNINLLSSHRAIQIISLYFFQGIGLFYLTCQIFCADLSMMFPCYPFDVYMVCSAIPFFTLVIGNSHVLCFCVSLARRLSILLVLSVNQVCFMNFLHFKFSASLISALIYYFLFSACFEFILLLFL